MNVYFPFFLILLILIIFLWFQYKKSGKAIKTQLRNNLDSILNENVAFYRKLSAEEQKKFKSKLQAFLEKVRITPVANAKMDDEDRILIGSSAIIPIFNFDDWEYRNLGEILAYPNSFSDGFDMAEGDRNILGMVGEGAMQRTMILSLPALRAGFANSKDGHNTGIHEFVHLLDKADGDTNGVPYYLFHKNEIAPWLHYMHEEMESIRKGKSDLNPYAAKNEAEFFAVAAEYFFEKPRQLQEDHPEIYSILQSVFSKKDER